MENIQYEKKSVKYIIGRNNQNVFAEIITQPLLLTFLHATLDHHHRCNL